MTWPHREQPSIPSPLPGAPSLPVDLSSFSELLRRQAPELLPVNRHAVPSDAVPHGTTIVALKYPGGVVMAGDRRSTQGNMIAGPRRAEGLHHRRLHGDRHRRHRGHRRRVRPAVRGRTGALRKARGRCTDVRRQGEPARDHGPGQPRRRAAGLRRAAAARRLRPRRPQPGGRRSNRLLRRGRRLELRGRGLSVGGVGLDLRQVVDEEAVLAGGRRGFRIAGGRRSALRRRRRRLRDRRAGSGAWHLPDGRSHRRPKGRRKCPSSASRSLRAEIIESRSRADTFGPDAVHRSTDARGDS